MSDVVIDEAFVTSIEETARDAAAWCEGRWCATPDPVAADSALTGGVLDEHSDVVAICAGEAAPHIARMDPPTTLAFAAALRRAWAADAERGERAHEYALQARGVVDPCERCHGHGARCYASAATWRGGAGGQALAWDVCDACWGSGDSSRRGVDLRALEAEARQARAEAAELRAEVERLRSLADDPR